MYTNANLIFRWVEHNDLSAEMRYTIDMGNTKIGRLPSTSCGGDQGSQKYIVYRAVTNLEITRM